MYSPVDICIAVLMCNISIVSSWCCLELLKNSESSVGSAMVRRALLSLTGKNISLQAALLSLLIVLHILRTPLWSRTGQLFGETRTRFPLACSRLLAASARLQPGMDHLACTQEIPVKKADLEEGQSDAPVRVEGLKRTMRPRHTQMIAIGGILGSGE